MITSSLANCLSEIFESVVEDHNLNRYEVFDVLNTADPNLLATQASYDHETREIKTLEGQLLYRVV